MGQTSPSKAGVLIGLLEVSTASAERSGSTRDEVYPATEQLISRLPH